MVKNREILGKLDAICTNLTYLENSLNHFIKVVNFFMDNTKKVSCKCGGQAVVKTHFIDNNNKILQLGTCFNCGEIVKKEL